MSRGWIFKPTHCANSERECLVKNLLHALLSTFRTHVKPPLHRSPVCGLLVPRWPASLFHVLSWSAIERRAAWQIFALFGLLLGASPAQAIDYTFPGALPVGCVDNANGAYSCSALTLAAGDTVTLLMPKPVTITFNGAFTTGAGVQINTGGATSDLKLVVNGAVTLGANSTLNATLQTLGAGDVTIAAGSRVSGNVSTETGFVGLGAPSTVGGNISTLNGYVVLGAFAQVGGSVSTLREGYVVLGASANIGGSVSVSGAGYVTTGDSATVGGSISTVSDAVTVGANSKVGGSIAVSQTGAVTLGASASVGGNISTEVGATSVGANGTVGGQIAMNVTGAITIGAGGRVYAVCCYGTDSSCLTDGSGVTPGPLVCVVAVPTNFDCLETGATYNNLVRNPSARNPLFTKLAGTSFTFDVVALKGDGTIQTSYAAGSNKSVRLELVDGSGATACASRAAIIPAGSQSLTFVSGHAGRQAASMSVTNAYENLRCRVTDSTQSPSIVGCSADNFSIRPSAVILLTSASAAAPSAASTPAIKANANFTLTTTTRTGGIYAGSLRLDTGKLTAQNPAQDTMMQSGGAVGVLSPLSLAANTSANAAYSEVGYLYLAPGAYRDDIFTAVDSATGDCISSTANDNNLTDTLIGNQYGCSIGNRNSASFGRFYPDHFAISAPVLTAACTASMAFSYFGQDGFTTAFTLQAQNAVGGITQNYAGVFAKLNLTNYASYGFSAAPLPAGSSLASSAISPSGNWGNGVASVLVKHQISRPTTPVVETLIALGAAPFDAEVRAVAAASVGSPTRLRYGRLQMKNAYGSELLALPVPLEAQYWSVGGYYVTNTDDSCTRVPASSIVMGNYLKQLSACETQISPLGNVSLLAGKLPGAGLVFSRPGTGNAGSVDLSINVSASTSGNTCVGPIESAATAANMPWFGANPGARATFGVYKNSLIYQRENY